MNGRPKDRRYAKNQALARCAVPVVKGGRKLNTLQPLPLTGIWGAVIDSGKSVN